ncbi:uncharacterized protein LAESUDRAFT_755534 [Laetiporus sulphureus 93-53]|uniref:Uncharacterized protein n=1 Tax=Laetiporus sulphureus 93-53 TaxID=1314785 RepID=A0A165GVP7_9APHY|nr:uncharacterized protein LAESUDRAFT_755534 [Laetiporus sulphureus 93-53]KZT10885.1 hypothetical protein LAESUDRAFT_755534 [Laetiporus sulphureus 93-53]
MEVPTTTSAGHSAVSTSACQPLLARIQDAGLAPKMWEKTDPESRPIKASRSKKMRGSGISKKKQTKRQVEQSSVKTQGNVISRISKDDAENQPVLDAGPAISARATSARKRPQLSPAAFRTVRAVLDSRTSRERAQQKQMELKIRGAAQAMSSGHDMRFLYYSLEMGIIPVEQLRTSSHCVPSSSSTDSVSLVSSSPPRPVVAAFLQEAWPQLQCLEMPDSMRNISRD